MIRASRYFPFLFVWHSSGVCVNVCVRHGLVCVFESLVACVYADIIFCVCVCAKAAVGVNAKRA